MSKLTPESHRAWYWRSFAAGEVEYGLKAKAFKKAIELCTREDEKDLRALYLYGYVYAVLRRGGFPLGDLRKFFTEARHIEQTTLKPLGLKPTGYFAKMVRTYMEANLLWRRTCPARSTA
jgi:hypothetical protein